MKRIKKYWKSFQPTSIFNWKKSSTSPSRRSKGFQLITFLGALVKAHFTVACSTCWTRLIYDTRDQGKGFQLNSFDIEWWIRIFRILYLWFPKLETTTTTTAAPETTSSERTIDKGSVDFNDYITESLEADLSENEDSSENRIEKFNSVFRTK